MSALVLSVLLGTLTLPSLVLGFFFGSSCRCPPPAPPPVCNPQPQPLCPPPPPPPACNVLPPAPGPAPPPVYYPPPAPIAQNYPNPSYAQQLQVPQVNQIVAPPAPLLPPGGQYVHHQQQPYLPHSAEVEPFKPPSVAQSNSVETEAPSSDLFPEYDRAPEPTHSPSYIKEQHQIEVTPAIMSHELSYREKDIGEEEEEELADSLKRDLTVKKTTLAPSTTSTTNAMPTTTVDVYDDKLPDIDDEYYENSSNRTRKFKSDMLANDYSEASYRARAKAKAKGVKSRVTNERDDKCGNGILKRIMMENIVSSPTISKQLIFSAGRQQFHKAIDVVCSRNKFSYTVVSSKVFCEVTKAPVTCFAFFQP